MGKVSTCLGLFMCVATAACGAAMRTPATAAVPAETKIAEPDGEAMQPAADAEPAAAVIDNVDGTKVELPGEIEYAFRSAKIARTRSNEAILGQLLAFLHKNESVTMLRIEGHTDSIGNHARNQRLSEARARSVAKWLAAHGVDDSRFHIVGFGPDKPIADNATPDGRAKNRRTEFHLEQIEGKPAEQVLAKAKVSTPIVAAAVSAKSAVPVAATIEPVAAKPATPAAPPQTASTTPAPAPVHALNVGWDVRMNHVLSYQHAGTSGAFACSPIPKDHLATDIYAGVGDVYGWNSGICAAAVYAGKITKENGGTFTLVYRGLQPRVAPAVTATPRAGITTKPYEGGESFAFEGAGSGPITLGWHNLDSGRENMQRLASYFFTQTSPGEAKTFLCPPMPAGEKPQTVKVGDGAYSLLSVGCWAAVHAGKITREKGGTFTVVIKGNEAPRPLASVTQNGVASDRDSMLGGTFVTIQ